MSTEPPHYPLLAAKGDLQRDALHQAAIAQGGSSRHYCEEQQHKQHWKPAKQHAYQREGGGSSSRKQDHEQEHVGGSAADQQHQRVTWEQW
mmetsp:Transcript_38313/g.63589  ORF Transcript_38313/g.63589 Transcript_38313/m.63589 type:complete len:91 (+) Transcript_38313:812-1084(+)